MPDVRFDHYYRYDDLTRFLHQFAAEYPNLVRVESIGRSYEGRDIWLATVTNFETGAAEQKPALWADANIHATEVSPTSAVLYFLNKLTREYGSDKTITECLDTRVFYLCPRVNPDGAELALADKPKFIRSSTRPYPYDEEAIEGLEMQDMDGDGRILMMRVPDPNGQWKPHPDEPRLMIRREPADFEGTFYHLFFEGNLRNYDGVTIKPMPNREGLDLNRNFPSGWRQEFEQRGAGVYPTSEPEVHTIVDFVARHKNISHAITFHTWSGVLLRPYGTHNDDSFPAEDLWTFQKIGEKGTEITGYPAISVYHDFRYHPKEVITGVFDDWVYDHMGAFAWTVEIWNPQKQAGIDHNTKFMEWYREHPLEDDLKMLEWSDRELGGKGYLNWYEFDHPQLGKVELGGWDMAYSWRNPPPHLLEKEIAPFSDWLIWQAMLTPRLELFDASITDLGSDHYRVQVVLYNSGWLPTYTTKKALEKKLLRGVITEIELPDGAALKSGKQREDIGQLEGRAYTASAATPWVMFGAATADRAKVEWVVHAPKGGTVTVTARHDRAGLVRVELNTP